MAPEWDRIERETESSSTAIPYVVGSRRSSAGSSGMRFHLHTERRSRRTFPLRGCGIVSWTGEMDKLELAGIVCVWEDIRGTWPTQSGALSLRGVSV